jgi:hypothetical protein
MKFGPTGNGAAVNATNLTRPVVTLEAEVANPWRAGCLETCTSGSEGGVRKHSSAVRLAPTLPPKDKLYLEMWEDYIEPEGRRA